MFDAGGAPSCAERIRFAAHAPGVDCALVGTADAGHLAECARAVAAGPVARAHSWRARFGAVGGAWRGLV
jgi:hypothetical protein